MTVNKALSQLAKAGLIERRRRSGSFVRRPRSQAAVLEIHDIATRSRRSACPTASR
jgi:GntR family histidine utilization transcriptional repressor